MAAFGDSGTWYRMVEECIGHRVLELGIGSRSRGDPSGSSKISHISSSSAKHYDILRLVARFGSF